MEPKIEEIWKDVVGYEGLYKISSIGNLKSSRRMSKIVGSYNLTPTLTPDGYYRLSVRREGIKKNRTIHQLVAIAFIPNPNNYNQINHKNGIKTDNRVENLEWCSTQLNTLHAINNGLHPKGKITSTQATDIMYKIKKGISESSIATEYGVRKYSITRIKKGARWKHLLNL